MPKRIHSYLLEHGHIRDTTYPCVYSVPEALDIDMVLERVDGSEPLTTETLFATTQKYNQYGKGFSYQIESEWYHLRDLGLDEHHGESYYAFSVWEVRFYLEGVFYEDYFKFQQLVRKLIDSTAPHITSAREAFLDKLAKEEGYLSSPELLVWDDTQKQLFETMLNKIELTAKKSKIQAGDKNASQLEKSQRADKMIGMLKRQIAAFTPRSEEPNRRKLEILNFKLDLIRTLRSYDHVFNQHSDYQRLFVNLLTILLTGSLLNVVNWCFTGDFLFCNQPESQKQVMSAQKSLGFFAMDVPNMFAEAPFKNAHNRVD